MKKWCLLFLIYFSVDVKASNDFVLDTVLRIPQGKIRGSLNLSGSIRRFLGIPYASINGRFRAPGDAPTWNDTFDATNDNPGCKQFSFSDQKTIGTEDCLALNVYTPLSAVNKSLPVMVFIHGGDFVSGNNSHLVYDPKYLIDKNNVVVTINYRLGALGFLCLRNEGAPGNVGLKDQVAALKWVQNNIEYFGGNTNSITLFGQDVGAASINYLLVIPSTNGLFQKVILQSGSILMPQAFDDNPIRSASSIAAQSGYNSTDPDELLQYFSALSVDELIRLTTRDPTNNPFAKYVFRPCIESSGKGALITAHPRDLLKSAELNPDLKVIIGYNDKDGTKWASNFNYSNLSRVMENFEEYIPDNLEIPEEDRANFVQDVKKMYVADESQEYSVFYGLIDFFSDIYVMYPSVVASEYLLNNTNLSLFNYYFGYFALSLEKLLAGIPQIQGASNGDELTKLFDSVAVNANYSDPFFLNDAITIYRMTMMWSYFALNGDPSIPEDSRLPWPLQWPKSLPNNVQFLEIIFEYTMVPIPNIERIDFWKNAYETYGKNV